MRVQTDLLLCCTFWPGEFSPCSIISPSCICAMTSAWHVWLKRRISVGKILNEPWTKVQRAKWSEGESEQALAEQVRYLDKNMGYKYFSYFEVGCLFPRCREPAHKVKLCGGEKIPCLQIDLPIAAYYDGSDNWWRVWQPILVYMWGISAGKIRGILKIYFLFSGSLRPRLKLFFQYCFFLSLSLSFFLHAFDFSEN